MDVIEGGAATAAAPVQLRVGMLSGGLRALLFLRPRDGAPVSPWTLVGLLALVCGLELLVDRMWVGGPAILQPQSWGTGWLELLFVLAACALVARGRAGPTARFDGTSLFAWVLALRLWGCLLWLLLLGVEAWTPLKLPLDLVGDGTYWGWMAWKYGATAWLLLWAASGVLRRVGVALLVAMATLAAVFFPRHSLWSPVPTLDGADWMPPTARLSQEVLEGQSRSLVAALDAVLPQRDGVPELYAITFAPFADEDVFSREAAMVGGVLAERFDTTGRWLNLQNHPKTVASVPWATPLNLERAIHRMAQRMNLEEDVLFIHLTSHGGRDGQLATAFAPLSVAPVTPQLLRQWLDAAGVQHAVISISACFSGSWLEPLASEGTLVMTAADAKSTSYGCGRLSPLTFFGRAVFDEQLRRTRSFTEAFAAALPVIDRREKEAKKPDGPSNPQIQVGAKVSSRLQALVERLEKDASLSGAQGAVAR